LGLGYAVVTAGLAVAAGPSVITIGVPTLILLLLLADGVARPGSSVLVPTVTRGPSGGDRVALTFDDGPHPEHTPAILDALADAGAGATFFCVGRHLDAHPEVARRLRADGHELGNHSYEHAYTLNFRGVAAMTAEIKRGEAAVPRAGGQKRPLYRPPVGLKNPPLSRVAQRLELTVVTWSLHSRDTRTEDPRRVADRVLKRVTAGDIVLLHDRAVTVEALPKILEGLKGRGLRSVSVTEMLGRPRGEGSSS